MGEILRFPPRLRPIVSDDLKAYAPLGSLGPFGDEIPAPAGELLQLRPEAEPAGAGVEFSSGPPGGGSAFPAPRQDGEGGAAAHAVRWADVTGEACACVYHLVNLCNSLRALLHLALRYGALKVAAAARAVIRYGREK